MPPPVADDYAIHLEGVTARYWLRNEQIRSLQAYMARAVGRAPLYREVWALQDVTLSVRRGEVLGLVGPNGAGKSTLLRVVSRVLRPFAGRVVVRGVVAPLMDLGVGFNPDLTGRENVYLKAAMLGVSHADTNRRMTQIVEFAGLHEFIDAPLRTYSSGMVARLGFAVSTDMQPDVLLIDEVLQVGDAEFRQRSSERILELCAGGTTVLIVSHSLEALQGLCDRIVWMAYGRVQMAGLASSVIRAYSGWSADEERGQPGSVERLRSSPRYELQPDEILCFLEMAPESVIPAACLATVEARFDPQDIYPARTLTSWPGAALRSLAGYRLVRGRFFYNQLEHLLRHAAVSVTVLQDPLERALDLLLRDGRGLSTALSDPAFVATIHDHQTRRLGARELIKQGLPLDDHYSDLPVGNRELARACAVLEDMPFFGLVERPRESMLLLWYTFGWMPDAALGDIAPYAAIPAPWPDPQIQAALGQLNRFDQSLYAQARQIFEARFTRMSRDLIAESGAAIASDAAADLETLYALARRNAEQQQQERARQAPPLRFSFDRPVPGSGWYAAEYDPQHGPFRWTGPGSVATIALPLPAHLSGQDLTLRLWVIHSITPETLDSLRLSVNGVAIAHTTTHSPAGLHLCVGHVPCDAIGGDAFARLTLAVIRTMVPGEGFDRRRLGLALARLELDCQRAPERATGKI